MRSLSRGIVIVTVLILVAGRGLAQTSNSPPPLAVEVFVGGDPASFHAPTNIVIQAFVTMPGVRADDSVTIAFFANTNKLGSKKAVWHGAKFPPNDPHHFHYMHVVAAGFDNAYVVWKNAPAGSYALTARVSNVKGLSALSQPVNITVLPSQ
jgi:hypothetical protein